MTNPYLTLIIIGYCAVLLYAGVCYLVYLYDVASERSIAEIDGIMDRQALREKELGGKTFTA